jgi:hypothetical protein
MGYLWEVKIDGTIFPWAEAMGCTVLQRRSSVAGLSPWLTAYLATKAGSSRVQPWEATVPGVAIWL